MPTTNRTLRSANRNVDTRKKELPGIYQVFVEIYLYNEVVAFRHDFRMLHPPQGRRVQSSGSFITLTDCLPLRLYAIIRYIAHHMPKYCTEQYEYRGMSVYKVFCAGQDSSAQDNDLALWRDGRRRGKEDGGKRKGLRSLFEKFNLRPGSCKTAEDCFRYLEVQVLIRYDPLR